MSIIKKYFSNFSKKNNLIDKEENFRICQQIIKTGSWTHDIQNNEIFLSDEVYRILECTHKEFGGELEEYYQYVHPDDLKEAMEATQGALKGKEYNIEYRIITSNGTEKFIHERTKALYDENNNPIKMVGIIQDISAQKIVENNLRELGDNLNIAQHVSGVGSWKYDVKKDENFWSDEVYNIFNIEPTKFDRSLINLINLIHPEDRHGFNDDIKKSLNGKAYKHEYRIPQPDGNDKYVVSKGEPIFDANNCVIGIIGIIQDVTEIKLLQNKIEKIHQNLTVAQKLSHIGSWELDLKNDKYYWSEENCRIFGFAESSNNISYEDFLKCVHPEDKEFIRNIHHNSKESDFIEAEFRIIRLDGSLRNLYVIIECEFDNNENLSIMYGTTHDITEQKQLQMEIEKTNNELIAYNKRINLLVQASNDVFEIIDTDGTIKYISAAVENVTGLKIEERIGKNVLDFYKGNEKQKLSKMIELTIKEPGKEIQDTLILKSKAGKEIYLEVIMKNFISEPLIQGIIINFRDTTQRVAMEKRMVHISTHDDLTDLPNKTYLRKKLKLQCKYSDDTETNFALIMLEVDGLKNLNYTLGYECENHLIKDIVEKLKEYLGSIFLSRISEYKFAIMVHRLTIERYESIAKDLINIFKQDFIIDNFEINLSVNIGICVYPDESEDSISIIKNSNIALLRAINEGKNNYKFFSSGLDIQYYKEFSLRNDLHKAIEDNQLEVYYQPIVNLKTSEIIAAEALIRWEHPEWGILYPEEFIPLAEESGMIIEVGKWVLREVCKNYNTWMENKRPSIKVSVNFSSNQFIESNFVKNIKSILGEFKLEPHFLIMEITESVLIDKIERVISNIKELQSYGIQIALDDFGIGYSSFEYLNSFKIDILKIDRCFIKKIIEDKTSSLITKIIINMAKELNIKIVAEGIEKWEQLTYLRGLNCYSGQGHIYSKPLSAKSFEIELDRGKCIPLFTSNKSVQLPEERRNFFRINFHQMLEADMTVINLRGRNVKVGNNKVLIKDIGPGGLYMISNIRLPIDKDITLLFTTNLVNTEIKIYGRPIRIDEHNCDLYRYGVEFTVDDNERADLVKILNQVQVKMRKDILFSEGSFISGSAELYFSLIN